MLQRDIFLSLQIMEMNWVVVSQNPPETDYGNWNIFVTMDHMIAMWSLYEMLLERSQFYVEILQQILYMPGLCIYWYYYHNQESS